MIEFTVTLQCVDEMVQRVLAPYGKFVQPRSVQREFVVLLLN